MTSFYARIIGTGGYLPAKVLSNRDLERMMDTTDEWIYTRTGMLAHITERMADIQKSAA